MSSLETINAQIAEYEKKIAELKNQRKIINFKNFMDENDLNQMEDIEVKTEVQTNYSQDDDYAHWMDATLSVKFTYKGCKENLRIVYSEEKGYHTESRYRPTITRDELKGTTLAMRILFKNLDFEFQDVNEFIYCRNADDRAPSDWFKIRDMIITING